MTAEFDNSFATVHNKEIDIHYRKKNLRMAVDKVAKIYLSKKKPRYRSWIPGMRFFADADYDLCIKTRDNKEIRLDVKADERQPFINHIGFVRNLNMNSEISQAS